METITIKTQEEFDKLGEIKESQSVVVECEIKVGNVVNVRGKILFKKKTDMSFNESRYVEARGNSSVVARENSSVVARGNSSVVAWENSVIRVFASLDIKLSMFGFSVLIKPNTLKLKFKRTKTVLVQNYRPQPYLKREGILTIKGYAVLFKRTSLIYKTQENTENETTWTVGTTLTHPDWNPQKTECGEGKYHACSRPYFCDEFRSNKGDIYIAVKIAIKDLYEWKGGQYPHKIAFRQGTVLYRCDRFGKEVKQ